MKKRKMYELSFTVTDKRTVTVEASSADEAIEIAEETAFDDVSCDADVDFDEVIDTWEADE